MIYQGKQETGLTSVLRLDPLPIHILDLPVFTRSLDVVRGHNNALIVDWISVLLISSVRTGLFATAPMRLFAPPIIWRPPAIPRSVVPGISGVPGITPGIPVIGLLPAAAAACPAPISVPVPNATPLPASEASLQPHVSRSYKTESFAQRHASAVLRILCW